MASSAETLKIRNPELDLIDEIARKYYDTATAAAEALDGSMYTVIPLGYDGRDIYSRKDGTHYGEMMQNSLDAAEDLYFENPNYQYEWRRRKRESEELPLMLEMAEGRGPNTLIVVSDFPPELMEAEQDVGGYNVRRKQTMLRVITRRDDGSLTLETQSLDGSNRAALEAIYAEFGMEPSEDELLGQRIVCDLTEEDQADLCAQLTAVYDFQMQGQFGGDWYAGRPTQSGAARINTYEFVQDQLDVLIPYINSAEYGNYRLQYGMFQLLAERFKLLRTSLSLGNYDDLLVGPATVKDESKMIHEIHMAATRGQIEGAIFSSCGGTVKGSEDPFGLPGQLDDFERAGYGNKVKAELSWHGGSVKRGKCVSCHEGPKDVGVKSWCKDCIGGHCGKK